MSEETDYIVVQIICGSYLNYIKFIIFDYSIDDYDTDDIEKILETENIRAMKRIERIPKNYFSLNMDEFQYIITNYNGLKPWLIRYLQLYFEC